ncbi:MAG: pyrophosphate--fructose-6-phosphate 1-phosphotransferase [Acidobacteria bacterium RIFCSPLOWO2_12_FULL_54_10]|nr:MAG: pyrophosphate--fructose-6-phosphate 1-phosphotransferase [Acidobacteria bacterium RIFCSPLOWO2_12_FULL_54_10]
MNVKTVGILTGGGDCPGLNAVIRAVVRRGDALGYKIVGILEGWRGLLENKVEPLNLESVSGILYRGGTILRTSRTNPLKHPNGMATLQQNLQVHGIDALIAVGGDDTLSVTDGLFQRGVCVVGVPKTIDNDLSGTDYCFGFDTAVNIATEAIDRLHTTAEAHNRVMIVEVMGRDTGWIAVAAGLAGGADLTLIPERAVDFDQICDVVRKRSERGKYFSIIVVAEGVKLLLESGQPGQVRQGHITDEFGHVQLGGVGTVLARELESRLGMETRVVVLGHVQRGGSPTAFDRILATRFGVAAIDMVHQNEFGKMVALQGNQIVGIPLKEAAKGPRPVSAELYATAAAFFG